MYALNKIRILLLGKIQNGCCPLYSLTVPYDLKFSVFCFNFPPAQEAIESLWRQLLEQGPQWREVYQGLHQGGHQAHQEHHEHAGVQRERESYS